MKCAGNEIDDDEDISENEMFMEKYDKLFINTIEKLREYKADPKKRKRSKIPLRNVMFALDSPRSSLWRMNIFTEYKGKRPKDCNT